MEEKLFAGLCIIIITLSVLCGFLMLHMSGMQNQNGTLEDQISAYQGQIGELKNQTKNQTSELEEEIYELEKQINALEAQIYQRKLADAKRVKITEVEVRGVSSSTRWFASSSVYVTIKNYGSNAVDGLMLSVGADSENLDDVKPVGLLGAGSTKRFFFGGEDTLVYVTDTVILRYDNVIVDEEPI